MELVRVKPIYVIFVIDKYDTFYDRMCHNSNVTAIYDKHDGQIGHLCMRICSICHIFHKF